MCVDSRWAAFADDHGAFFARLDGSLHERVVVATDGVVPRIQLSPSGHWLLVRLGSDPWQLYRTDALEDDPVQLSGPAHSYLTFDASEQYLAVTVWKLAQPDQPHILATGAQSGYAWMDGATNRASLAPASRSSRGR